jgi:hypothetical protein
MSNAFLMRPLQWAAISTDTVAAGFTAANLAPWPIPRMGRVWRSTASGPFDHIYIDLGAVQPIDTIALFGIGSGNAAPSASWNWRVDLSNSPILSGFPPEAYIGSTAPLLAGSVLPASNRGKALWLAPSGAPASARYIRIALDTGSAVPLQIALVAVGQRFQPARNFNYGAAFGVRDLGQIDYSPRGVVLRRPGAKLRGMGLTFAALRREEVEDSLQRLFERVGNTDPVVLVTDPDAHPHRQNRMGIGHLTGNLGTIHRVPNAFQAELNFVAVD